VLVPTIVLSLAGVYVSFNLLAKHYAKTSGVGWFDTVCEGGEESARSCDQVLGSDYGVFPAAAASTLPTVRYQPVTVLGWFSIRPRSVALYGLMYFSVLAVWYLAVGRPSRSRRLLHLAPLLFNVCGVGGAVYFVYLMFAKMEAWCPWCVVTHVINGLLLICAILLWPRKGTVAATVATDPGRPTESAARSASAPLPGRESEHASARRSPETGDSPAAARPTRHPSLRLCLVTLACIVAVVAAEWYLGNIADANELLAHQKQYVIEFTKEMSNSVYGLYLSQPKQKIALRADDPVRNPGKPRLSLVVFSDFQCPHCAVFARFLEQKVEPMYDGLLKVTFKHFPANKACNQRVAKDLHPQACVAARAAEAARVLGGNETFWMAHDLLFGAQKRLAQPDYDWLAEQLELDPERFAETMESPEVNDRIGEDIAAATAAGVNATPSLYLSSRRVPKVAVRMPLFWRRARAELDKVLQRREERKAAAAEQKPPSQRQPVPATQPAPRSQPTPGSPGP
jgi:protein-disulfide isomerase/uncharacterized membrane protein